MDCISDDSYGELLPCGTCDFYGANCVKEKGLYQDPTGKVSKQLLTASFGYMTPGTAEEIHTAETACYHPKHAVWHTEEPVPQWSGGFNKHSTCVLHSKRHLPADYTRSISEQNPRQGKG